MSLDPASIPADTRHKQQLASDPGRSAWVSANAGSGKTFVLTRRVVRLLLAGVAPSRILCLTFTKAAAANMALKVFETLSAWVTLDDSRLAAAIVATGAPRPAAADLAAARRLFARTVETPGGLKILTIHAFCEKLLHGFPFEANVAAGFSVIEELRQAELMSRAREAVLAAAVSEPDTPLGTAVAALSGVLSLEGFGDLLGEIATHREAMQAAVAAPHGLAGLRRRLEAALGADGRTVAAIEQAILQDGLPPPTWVPIAERLREASSGKSETADRLLAAAAAAEPDRVGAYLEVVLTQKLVPREASYLPKRLRATEPALCARLDAEQDRLAPLLAARSAAAAVERTSALLTVAAAVLGRYETLKNRAGLLDFADLIARSRVLLTRAGNAWVLYKLDAGIEHILVDEAQDTSPDQWSILQAISRDFFAGEGAIAVPRTVFAVGDEKQSIFSFQGARPATMQRVHAEVEAGARGAGHAFDSLRLLLSFRSAASILDVVDRVFAHGGNGRGLMATPEPPPPHQALKAALPGLVEIWPKVEKKEPPDPADWRLPLDIPETGDPAVIVAGRIADAIRRMTAPGSGETVDDGAGGRRAVRAGDVMILVRARNAVFEAVIRALKERRVPVAGADRLNLTEHIATLDLAAAGRAALLPDDDLTLACVLKSPLIGLDDDDLIRLAPGRTGSLGTALRASPLPQDQRAAARLAVWRDRATTLTPFAFYTRLLGQDDGRRQLLGRLGPEAADVIDEFLALTLAHERDGAPSLLAFLARLEGTPRIVKRDLAAAGDAVRVMTVHAAKGLEAKIVFLPDTCGAPRKGNHEPKLFPLDDDAHGPLVAWSPRAETDTAAIAARRAEAFAAALDEHRRLLYVALTRAEERLYIAGFHGPQQPSTECWHDMIMAAGLGLATVPAPWDARDTILRRADRVEGTLAAVPSEPFPTLPLLPVWLTRPARPEAPAAPPVRPSTALGAADRPDRIDPADTEPRPSGARRRAALAGRLTHQLLQHLPALPAERRESAAQKFLARLGGRLDAAGRDAVVATALAVIADPALAPLFGPGSRAEVAIAATITRPGRAPLAVTGQIDRLAEQDGIVTLAEFKSGTPRPLAETPPTYLAQLALYEAALRPLYPEREIRAFLVWTAGPRLVPVDAATLAASLDALMTPAAPMPG